MYIFSCGYQIPCVGILFQYCDMFFNIMEIWEEYVLLTKIM
uniref:Uncharacterized protein n=1 Tax=Anguilla anguilla TaxID=7936 RepID=A0A0E9VVT3_ANGAN